MRRRRVAVADADQSAATRAGVILGHGRLHEPRAGARQGRRQAHRHLGVRLRAVRDADRHARVSRATMCHERWRAVIEREPDWEALPPIAPPFVLRIVRRCLQKDLSQRLRDIGDARLELLDAVALPERRDAVEPGGRRLRPSAAVLLAAGLVLGVVGGSLVTVFLRSPAPVATRPAAREYRNQCAARCVPGSRRGGRGRRFRLHVAGPLT